MQKKWTITLDEEDLERAYLEMAQDEAREADALEWTEATAGDVADAAPGRYPE
jgi:hypothetical protein